MSSLALGAYDFARKPIDPVFPARVGKVIANDDVVCACSWISRVEEASTLELFIVDNLHTVLQTWANSYLICDNLKVLQSNYRGKIIKPFEGLNVCRKGRQYSAILISHSILQDFRLSCKFLLLHIFSVMYKLFSTFHWFFCSFVPELKNHTIRNHTWRWIGFHKMHLSL